MSSLSIYSPRVFEVFILKFIKSKLSHNSHMLESSLYISILLLYANHFWLDEIVLKISGDIEENPGPKPSSNQSFSICHWSLNNISAYNYIKVSF